MTPTLERSIPFYDYRSDFLAEEAELVRLFRETGRRGAFILQRDLEQFESRLAAFTGARYALGVANATDALHLALRASGIGPGDEVLFPSHTMTATAAAIHFTGATPVPVDCHAGPARTGGGPGNLSDHLMDATSAAAAVTPRTRALLPVHLNGRTCAMEPLLDLAARHQLLVIEDAAQALGSRYRGRCAGTFGAAGAISFYPAKLLGCLGDGGAVLTNDEALYERLYALRDHGRDRAGRVAGWGFNSRLDNLQAAILNHRLDHFAQAIARRRDLARLYQQRLETIGSLVLPPAPDSAAGHFDVFQNYEIEAAGRDRLRALLQSRGIGTLIPWGGKAVHQCESLGLRASLPHTEALFERVLLLPLNPSLSDEDVHAVADAIEEFYG